MNNSSFNHFLLYFTIKYSKMKVVITMNYDLNTLEYNKILNKLENYINTEYTLELLYKELPSNNYNKIIDKLNETEELRLLIIKNNSIPFQKLNNVNYLFEKALKDGILYEDEFNEIRKILSLIIDVKITLRILN